MPSSSPAHRDDLLLGKLPSDSKSVQSVEEKGLSKLRVGRPVFCQGGVTYQLVVPDAHGSVMSHQHKSVGGERQSERVVAVSNARLLALSASATCLGAPCVIAGYSGRDMIMRGVAAQDCVHVRRTGGRSARVTTSTGGGGQQPGRTEGCRPAGGSPSFSQRRCGQGRAQHVVITAQPEAECGQLSRMEHHGHSSGKSPLCPVQEVVTMTALFVHLRPHWCTNTCTCKGRPPGWFCECVSVCVRMCPYNIVQVDVGAPPNELLYDLQIALLCCHHQGSLSVLEHGARESGREREARVRTHTHCDTRRAPLTI